MFKYLWPKNKPIMLMFSIVFGGGLGYSFHRFNYSSTDNSSISQSEDINNTPIVDSQKQLTHISNISEDLKSEKQQQIKVMEQKDETSSSVNENENVQISQEEASPTLQQTQNVRNPFAKLADIKEWNFNDKIVDGELVLIVADLPFNPSFEANIIKQINQICKNNKAVKILRKDLTQEENKTIIENVYKGIVKKQTLFLLKNNYQNSLNNIDFDMYMQYPRLLEIYLKTVPLFKEDNISALTTTISNLNAHQSCLLYLYDIEESAAKQKQRLMTAKYIEMELLINNLPAVSLYAVERKAAVKCGLIDQSSNRTNSIHLFRKHNIYTPFDPNYYLQSADSETAIPFHRLTDVGFFAKGSRNLMIPTYLSNIQTFDSSQLGAPFVCTLKVDRNRISSQQYVKLLQIFGELKRSNVFPDVCFALRLKQIPYSGETTPKNKQWQITLSNIDELDKQSIMHEIKTQEQLKQSGFNEQNYLRLTHEYLYEHTLLTTSLVREFIEKATKGQHKDYFKSEQRTVLAPIKKLAANQFKQSILNNESDHLLFQFSDFCPTCKQISPLIGGFADIIQKKGLGLQGLCFHRIDANKNRVKQYITSPYIPNIYYFKNEWKNNGPVRFPIEFLSHQGPVQLYNFCSITKQIKTMEWSHIEKAISSAKTFKAEQFII